MYYVYHEVMWPHIIFLAEDGDKVVGYVLAKLEDEKEKANADLPPEAHITSLSVVRTHRKLGIATRLMRAAHYQMINVYHCKQCSLRVRVTNRAAIALYKGVLGYEIADVDKSYYADGEDAYDMKIVFNKDKKADEKVYEEKKQSELKQDEKAEEKKEEP